MEQMLKLVKKALLSESDDNSAEKGCHRPSDTSFFNLKTQKGISQNSGSFLP